MFPRWNLLSILDRNRDKIAFIKKKGKLLGASFFLKLTDKSLDLIKRNKISLKDANTINKLMDENGRNIHFIGVLADGTKTILKGLRKVIKKTSPKTISWFKPDMDRIHFIKVGG